MAMNTSVSLPVYQGLHLFAHAVMFWTISLMRE